MIYDLLTVFSPPLETVAFHITSIDKIIDEVAQKLKFLCKLTGRGGVNYKERYVLEGLLYT